MSNIVKTGKRPPVRNNRGPILRNAAEFQPDAILLESHEPPITAHIVWILVVVLLMVLLIWAAFAKVDKIVSADGKLVTVRPPITMKALELTTIKQVHVRIGQHVHAGDILYTFDQTVNAAELSRLKEQLSSYTANRDRLKCELTDYQEEYTAPANANRDQLQQATNYMARRDYFRQKIRTYDATIARYQKSLETLEESMGKYIGRNKALARIETMYTDLNKQGVVSLKDLLEVQVQSIATAIQIDQQNVSIVESRQSLLSTQAEKDAFISDWRRAIVEELVEIERNVVTIEQQIPKYEMLVSKTELRSPCEAVVHELAPYQEGSAVRDAEALVTLIPTDCAFEAEVDIPAKDISWVKLGDECRLKFDAFPFQQYGTLDGRITYISRDAFERNPSAEGAQLDEGGTTSLKASGAMYQARLTLSGEFSGKAKNASLMPGMRLRAEIKVGERSVLNYVFNPFVKAMEESIREP